MRSRRKLKLRPIWKKIKAAKCTHPGDPLKIDCGYRPNGVIRLFHVVSLATEPDSANVLTFTHPQLSEGIARLEKAKTELTAIVEEDLNRQDERDRICRGNAATDVHPCNRGQSAPGLAERARLELHL